MSTFDEQNWAVSVSAITGSVHRHRGVLFVGRAQEKALVWRTQRRYNRTGEPYAWLVRSTAFINHFYL